VDDGRPEWQLSASAPPLIWDTGVDAAFVRSVIVFVALAAAATWAYRGLAANNAEFRMQNAGSDRIA
jgi:hypothetical protein